MTAETGSSVYEQPALRNLAGDTIRPGGLALTDQAVALCALPPGARVLDVGCGAGATVAHLAARHRLAVFGLDVSLSLLQQGRQSDGALPVAQAAGEQLPIGDSALDCVLAECSLSAMDDGDRTLDEFCRVLKAGGHLIVTDIYAREAQGGPLPGGTCVSGARSQADILEQIRAHGFDVIHWQDQSAALRELAVQLIFTYGSLRAFWQQAGATGEMGAAAARAKLGYFLLIARKGKG